MVFNKSCLVAAIVGVCLSGTVSVYGVLNSTGIEAVRSRTDVSKMSLSSADEAVVDAFIRDGLTQLFMEEDPWRAVDLREAVLAQKGSSAPSPYSTFFADTLAKHLRLAFEDASRLQDVGHRRRFRLHLIVLAGMLQRTEMVPLGLERVGDSDPTVQYWAVKSVTNPVVAAQLTSQAVGDADLLRSVVASLKEVVNESVLPETLRMMVEFANGIATPEARDLVSNIAELRISQYANWTVRYELMDAMVLTGLGKQILAESDDARRAGLLRRFAQLYSYVIERFALGQDFLSEVQKRQLVSVIAETENGAITGMLNRPHDQIRKAVDSGKVSAIDAERQLLLGGPSQRGQLAAIRSYDYGKGPGGAAMTEPVRLKVPGAGR